MVLPRQEGLSLTVLGVAAVSRLDVQALNPHALLTVSCSALHGWALVRALFADTESRA